MRFLLALLAGLAAALAAIIVVELAGTLVSPPPPIDALADTDAMARYLRNAPWIELLPMLLAWLAGAAAGGAVAARIARSRPLLLGACIGACITAASLGLLWALPEYPLWILLACALLPIPVALWAAQLAYRPRRMRETA